MNKYNNYPDELTEKMHSEFTVSRETRICLKAGCVWESVSPNASREEIESKAFWYGITYDDVMRYKHEWLTAIRNSEDRYAK